MTQIGSISYFELYHDKDEGVIRAFTNRDEFETEFDVPEQFDGSISSIREELYPQLVSRYNDWMMES